MNHAVIRKTPAGALPEPLNRRARRFIAIATTRPARRFGRAITKPPTYPVDHNNPPGARRDGVVLSVCRTCKRYTLLWLPARLCGRCVERAVDAEAARKMLAAFEAYEEANV